MKNRNSFNLDSKAVKQSVASIIFKYIKELEYAMGKLQNSYIPSVNNLYRILAIFECFDLGQIDILLYKSNGKYGSRNNSKVRQRKRNNRQNLLVYVQSQLI